MACHARPCGEGGEGAWGGGGIDVEGEDVNAPPHSPWPKAESPPPPGDTAALPPKAPRTSTPPEHAARERARGDVAQWQSQ